MFLQVDTSFTFCLAAIKNPSVDAAPSTPMAPAALLTSSHPAAWHLPSVILGNKHRFPHSSSCPVSPKKPKQEPAKIQVNGSSSRKSGPHHCSPSPTSQENSASCVIVLFFPTRSLFGLLKLHPYLCREVFAAETRAVTISPPACPNLLQSHLSH